MAAAPTMGAIYQVGFFYDVTYLEQCLAREITSIYFLSLDKECPEIGYPDSIYHNLPILRDLLQKFRNGNCDIADFLNILKMEITRYYSEVGNIINRTRTTIVTRIAPNLKPFGCRLSHQ
jgi:hypothetical protein